MTGVRLKGNFHKLVLVIPVALYAQSVKSNGNGNANVGVNKGQIVINNNVRMSPSVRTQLQGRAGDGNGWLGRLFPGSDPTDYGRCESFFSDAVRKDSSGLTKVPGGSSLKGKYLISLGGSKALCDDLPCDVISIDHKNVISLIKMKDSVGIKAEFSGEGGKVIATIEGNVVHVNQHIAMYFERPNVHTMRVVDQENREALWVSLENSHYVRMRAKFLDPIGDGFLRYWGH